MVHNDEPVCLALSSRSRSQWRSILCFLKHLTLCCQTWLFGVWSLASVMHEDLIAIMKVKIRGVKSSEVTVCPIFLNFWYGGVLLPLKLICEASWLLLSRSKSGFASLKNICPAHTFWMAEHPVARLCVLADTSSVDGVWLVYFWLLPSRSGS